MTAKTTAQAASLPVLDRQALFLNDTDETFDEFANHLARWCAQWIPSIGVPIMRKAHELYDNVAVCILLGKWYDLKLKATKDMHERLLRAADGSEWRWEQEGCEAEYDYPSNLDREQLNGYNDALRALLIG